MSTLVDCRVESVSLKTQAVLISTGATTAESFCRSPALSAAVLGEKSGVETANLGVLAKDVPNWFMAKFALGSQDTAGDVRY